MNRSSFRDFIKLHYRLLSSDTADGTNDFLYKGFLAKGVLYLLLDGIISKIGCKGCFKSDVH